MKAKRTFSTETIKRLSLYLRNLKRIRDLDINVISSDQIAKYLEATPVQFRKDLSYFGEFGKRGVGYNVKRLIKEIESILGTNKEWKIAIVGVGKLGTALLGFDGLSKFNIKIAYAFDSSKDKIGKAKKGIKIEHISKMKNVIMGNNIRIAIISTPPDVAQHTANELVTAGITGILNFAPVMLKVPGDVSVSNVDMACELESLIFFATKKNIR